MRKSSLVILLVMNNIISCHHEPAGEIGSVTEVMDEIVTRLYMTLSPEQLDTIGPAYILKNLTTMEKQVLATKYWYFNVNVPVTVSLMRHKGQENTPFWLETGGFKKSAFPDGMDTKGCLQN